MCSADVIPNKFEFEFEFEFEGLAEKTNTSIFSQDIEWSYTRGSTV